MLPAHRSVDSLAVGEPGKRTWRPPAVQQLGVEELQEEVRRLRKQLRQTELERAVLKKATAYFAKESQ